MAKIELTRIGGTYQQGSTPGVDRRFTERDLRVYPELLSLAENYARSFAGTWEVMASAKDLLLRQGTLPPQIAKVVLNVAWSDPSVIFEIEDDPVSHSNNVVPLPPHPSMRHFPPADSADDDDDEDYGPPPPARQRHTRTVVKVKRPFGMSGNYGKVLHRVDPLSEHYIDWRAQVSRGRWRWSNPDPNTPRNIPVLHVWWLCGAFTESPRLMDERPNKAVPYCRSGCFSAICPNCDRSTHLQHDDDPNDPTTCERCGRKVDQ